MVKVVAKFVVQKDRVEEFKDMVTELIEKTRKEEGNVFYELYQDVSNPQTLAFIEEWENQEALEIHMGTDHFKKTIPKLEDLLIHDMDKPEVNIYKLVK